MSSWYRSRQLQQHAVALRLARNLRVRKNHQEIRLFAIGAAGIIVVYLLAFSAFGRSSKQPLPHEVGLLGSGNNGLPEQRQAIPLDTPPIEFNKHQKQPDASVPDMSANLPSTMAQRREVQVVTSAQGYDYWRNVAVRLAKLKPDEALKELEATDPFETRSFESKLVQAETNKGAVLDFSEIARLFPCPDAGRRITLPDVRNHKKAKSFRDGNNEDFTFLFFQHLRKAGGTNFCSLAQKNLPQAAVPTYFCMPDRNWNVSKPLCAGCLHQWSNEEITSNMKKMGHRIIGNEWDPFDPTRFFDLPAVFATSFRKPLDRALSQFRFECVEDRGCKITNITEWWDVEKALYNVYTWTFTDLNRYGMLKVYQSGEQEYSDKRGNLVGQALDVVARYNLVLVMEWLPYASPLVKSTLGFLDTSMLTKRVRPHIMQYQRKDGQDNNKLGAAGVGKASWIPETYLSKEQYKTMSENLALDMILNEAARRIFLERLVCEA